MTVTTLTASPDGLETTTVTDTLDFFYSASGDPLYVSYNGTPYYYAANLQGDTVAILDGSGNPVVTYTYDAWGKLLSVGGTLADTLGALNPLTYRGYVYDTETDLYYLQSRYYNPTVSRFLNADAFASTGQGLLGNNMFAYCQNNPVVYCDPTGSIVQIWPTLFGNHDYGLIHRAVQLHIISTKMFTKELFMPGIGRADIYDPKTHEIWEIKHGGSTAAMQSARATQAGGQIDRYIKRSRDENKIIYQKGHAGAFTGAFILNCGDVSYEVTYHTPEDGVILYYVNAIPRFEPEATYSYNAATRELKERNGLGALAMGGFVVVGAAFLGGGLSFDPLCVACPSY